MYIKSLMNTFSTMTNLLVLDKLTIWNIALIPRQDSHDLDRLNQPEYVLPQQLTGRKAPHNAEWGEST